jgi:hypothetical protein
VKPPRKKKFYAKYKLNYNDRKIIHLRRGRVGEIRGTDCKLALRKFGRRTGHAHSLNGFTVSLLYVF